MKKIYLAGGWFSEEMAEEQNRIYEFLKKLHDVEIYNPKLLSFMGYESTNNEQINTLKNNVEHITDSDIVVAIYDGKDTGTIWETGFAYAINKPIIYYAEKLNGKPFNLMLAKTGYFAKNLDELNQLLNENSTFEFKNIYSSYDGIVE